MYHLLDNLGESERTLLRAIEEFRRAEQLDRNALGATYSNLGALYLQTGTFDKAETSLRAAELEFLAMAHPNHLRLAETFHFLGVVYNRLEDPQRTKQYLSKAIDAYREALQIYTEANAERVIPVIEKRIASLTQAIEEITN